MMDYKECIDTVSERNYEIKQLGNRIADLEQQLAAATGDGWTYVEDKLPPEDTPLWVTEWYPLYGSYRMMKEMRYIAGEWIDNSGIGHGRYIDDDGTEQGTYIVAWMLYPQPAPLRTAVSEEGQNA